MLEQHMPQHLAVAHTHPHPGTILCLQAHLGRFTALKTPISLEDWCSCFSRCPDLLSVSPEVLSERLSKLKALMIVDEEQAVLAVVKAPSLLQHAPGDIADKVRADYIRQLVLYASGSATRDRAAFTHNQPTQQELQH